MTAHKLWDRWLRSRRRLDVVERLPHRINRLLLPPKVRSNEDALAAALEHSRVTGRRVVLLVAPALAVFIDRGKVVLRTESMAEGSDVD